VSGPAQARRGGAVRYTLVVRNLGPDAASGVRLADTLPKGVRFRSASTPQGKCARKLRHRVLVCSLGRLASGGKATVRIVVEAPRQGHYTDRATVSERRPGDPKGVNNTSRITTRVR
jgi:uncharacterized repeat protein (TIGR01451 family)